MKTLLINISLLLLVLLSTFSCKKDEKAAPAIIIDHTCTTLTEIPLEFINQAKANLHIAYGHTSHGSQLLTGMTGLVTFKDNTYQWNNGTLEGYLDIRDGWLPGDLGSDGDLTWEGATRSYISDWRNADINVIIWSWCGGVSTNTAESMNIYLNAMNQLEIDYPNVKFVYMTGHLDGTGVDGNLNINNEIIRKFCKDNNKILYDFADIESYDPDGNYFLNKAANDACDYDNDGDGIKESNWAINWQNTHTENVDWYNCSSEHSQPLNANLKAYAAWWLWARLAGWEGK